MSNHKAMRKWRMPSIKAMARITQLIYMSSASELRGPVDSVAKEGK